jgi:hypothetical protein
MVIIERCHINWRCMFITEQLRLDARSILAGFIFVYCTPRAKLLHY